MFGVPSYFRAGTRCFGHFHRFDPSGTAHTSVTKQLWKIRYRSEKETFASGSAPSLAPYDPRNARAKSSSESAMQIRYPFSTDKALRQNYVRFDQGVRIGRLLEDMDAFSGNIASAHADDGQSNTLPATLVTACVDNIVMIHPFPNIVRSYDNTDLRKIAVLSPGATDHDMISCNVDFIMRGSVIWTGTSSMLVRIYVDAQNVDTSSDEAKDVGDTVPLLRSDFLFVARFSGPPPAEGIRMVVNPVEPQTEEEKQLFLEAADAKASRVQQAKTSLDQMVPTGEEAQFIHQLYRDGALEMSQRDVSSILELYPYRGSKEPRECVLRQSGCQEKTVSIPLSSTTVRTTLNMQPQEQNIWGNIFGGFLMRQAFEVAYTAVLLLSKSIDATSQGKIAFVAVDDINFLRPVEIGNLLTFTARVVYTKGRAAQVVVETEVYDLARGDKFLSNNFSFTFAVVGPEEDLGVKVVPRTYSDAMEYLTGRRAFARTLVSLEKQGSPYAQYLERGTDSVKDMP